MKRTLCECDIPRCIENAKTIFVRTASYQDGDGCMHDKGVSIDLCPAHAFKLLEHTLKVLSYNQCQEVRSYLVELGWKP